jgi:hypothetical protein
MFSFVLFGGYSEQKQVASHEPSLALTPSERASSYCHALDFARNYQSALVVAVESEYDFEVENVLSVAIVFGAV